MLVHKKNSRLFLNIGLVIIVALLIFLVVFEPGLDNEPAPSKLLTLDKNQITSIRIIHNDETIRLEKRDNKWMTTEPVKAEGNSFKINSLLDLATTRSFAHYSVNEIDLIPIRLDKPRSRVLFNDVEIAFGNTQPINHQRYVMVDNVVHLINDFYYHHTVSPAGNYVSFSLLPSGSDINKIVFPDNSVIENIEGKWTANIDISTDNITNLVNEWKHAEALEVKLYNESRPDRKIAISLSGSTQPVIFFILEKGNDVWLVNHSLTLKYLLTQDVAQKLLDPVSLLKSITKK
ncbi:MAG: DUF4340 domain-containing protein [Gammaproteobacteria bacterium]|nr:DUF4340 domain-containing protein [Gammaproteobacteria bacterium]